MSDGAPHLIVRSFSAERGNMAFIIPWSNGSGLTLKRRMAIAAGLWEGDPYLQEMHFSIEGILVEQDDAFRRWVGGTAEELFESLGWVMTFSKVPIESFQEINASVLRIIVEAPQPAHTNRSMFGFLAFLAGEYDGEIIESQFLANDSELMSTVIEW